MRLRDILNLPPPDKWEYLQQVVTTRNPTLVGPLDTSVKDDARALASLAQLIATELDVLDWGHVATLLTFIRWCFVDDECVMLALVRAGLDKSVLGVLSKLRKSKKGMANSGYETLETILASVADMFEWDFFVKLKLQLFIDELLAILTTWDDCHANIFAETASAFMVICSTDTNHVISILLKNKRRLGMLETVFKNLPRAKSFYYQALVLELAYRLHRHTRKSSDAKTRANGSSLINAFPPHIGKALESIQPKMFRQETRQLLNDFNADVGVIKSFQIQDAMCLDSSHNEVPIGVIGWADFGSQSLEMEMTKSADSTKIVGTMKIKYSDIEPMEEHQELPAIVLKLRSDLHFGDIVDGQTVGEWGRSIGCRIRVVPFGEAQKTMLELLRVRCCATNNAKSITNGKCTDPRMDAKARKAMKRKLVSNSADSVRDNQPTKQTRGAKRTHTDLTLMSVIGNATDDSRSPREPRVQPPTRKSGNSTKISHHKARSSIVVAVSHEQGTRRQDSIHTKQATVSGETKMEPRSVHPKPRAENFGSTCENDAKYSDHRTPSVQIKTESHHQRTNQRRPTVGDSLTTTFIIPRECDSPPESRPKQMEHESLVSHQREQFQRLQQLIDEILSTHGTYRSSRMTRMCDSASDRLKQGLDARSIEMKSSSVFEGTSSNANATAQEVTLAIDALDDFQVSTLHMIDGIDGVARSTGQEISALLGELTKLGSNVWRQELEGIREKATSLADEHVRQTCAKLQAIEKSFNTDELLAMQQMLQRI